MKNILHIISSPRGEASNSTKLGRSIVDRILEQHPDSTVTTNNVLTNDYEYLQNEHIAAFYTPEDQRTPEQHQTAADSDMALAELFDANIIVISVPLYNFNVPAALKGWIDHIVRAGKTFSYHTGKPEGLLKDKKVYLAIASNGVYSDGVMKTMDYAEPYLRFILGFLGLTDITTFRIEGSGIPGVMETAVEKGLEQVAVAV